MDFGKIIDDHFYPMPKLSVVNDEVVDNGSESRSTWREANGWLPIVQDTMICAPGYFACDCGIEQREGAIHRCVMAKSIEDATLDELRCAARCGNLKVSELTNSQKSELLQKLLK